MILLLFAIKLLFNRSSVCVCVCETKKKKKKHGKDEKVAEAKITRHHTIYVKLQNFQNISLRPTNAFYAPV